MLFSNIYKSTYFYRFDSTKPMDVKEAFDLVKDADPSVCGILYILILNLA